MRNVQDYIKNSKSAEQAIAQANTDAMIEIADRLRDIDEWELYTNIFKEYNEDLVHEMSELDDVFESLTPTEILEQLTDIHLSDNYFNGRTLTSGNDIWEVAEITAYELADWVLENDIEGFEDILEELDVTTDRIHAYYQKFDVARKLFEQRLELEGVEAVINTLWNM